MASFGMFAMLPYGQSLISGVGWAWALLILAANACLILPLAVPLSGSANSVAASPLGQQSVSAALAEARTHRGFWLVTLGFFVCGFQVVFVARALIIAAFISVPVTQWSVYCFAVAIGLIWFGTVPLVSGIVAQIFGVQYLSMLFGLVFVGHQIGSFFGGWLGDFAYQLTGSYHAVWIVAIGLSIIAAILNAAATIRRSQGWRLRRSRPEPWNQQITPGTRRRPKRARTRLRER